jgi:hypothetical protein
MLLIRYRYAGRRIVDKPALGLMKYKKNVDIELRKLLTTDATRGNKKFGEEDHSIGQMASYMFQVKPGSMQ